MPQTKPVRKPKANKPKTKSSTHSKPIIVGSLTQGVANTVNNTTTGAVKTVSTLGEGLGNTVKGLLSGNPNKIGEGLKKATVGTASQAGTTAITLVAGIFKTTKDTAGNVLTTGERAVKGTVKTASATVKGVGRTATTLASGVGTTAKGIVTMKGKTIQRGLKKATVGVAKSVAKTGKDTTSTAIKSVKTLGKSRGNK